MFHGSMVALVTPMHDDGSVDYEGLHRLVEFHIDNGTDAIVAVGTTGESATLSEKEHCDVVRFVVEKVAKRVPVIAGTGSNNTIEAIELSHSAMISGADACLLVTPYYNKPTQEGLVQHYKAIAKAVAIPQILYNVPGRTAVDMQPETVARLADVSNIVGIKEATGDISRVRRIRELCGDQIEIYSGDDATGIDLIEAGGKGTISVTANVAPKAMHQAFAAALAGDFATARRIDAKLALCHKNLFLEANPIPVKWALAEMGLIGLGIRLPLTPLSEKFHAPVREALRQAEIL
ncbi:MAG: 4-hydroxy-tetrahydrodipicolinate synthase [Gammaproteobacteria bacterium]|nr:4-hydroxy-tetrahydrodipicolinate synthase [Gammaproteobacteria bacterium]